MLEFDEPTHVYRWNGAIVPSVTQIIRAALGNPFEFVSEAVLDHKRKIGVAAHKAVELDSQGVLDDETVHPLVMPYLVAWRQFREQWPCEILDSEAKMYSGTYGFAGTPDLFAKLHDGSYCVIDLKTGLPGPQAAIQTAAYANFVEATRRFALQARNDGKYRLTEYTNPSDWPDFLACLRIFRLKESAK